MTDDPALGKWLIYRLLLKLGVSEMDIAEMFKDRKS